MEVRDLEKALAYAGGEHTLEEVLIQCECGRMQLFNNANWVAVTEVVEYARKRRLRVILFAGVFDEGVYSFFKTFAESLNLDGIEINGRKGWEKKLAFVEPDRVSTIMVKDFGDEK